MSTELLHEELALLQSCVKTLGASKPGEVADGEVELHWPNGSLLARGTITDGKMSGFWELFTEEGEPLISAALNQGHLECYFKDTPETKA